MGKKEIITEFRNYIRSRNGGIYKNYEGSVLESDLTDFIHEVIAQDHVIDYHVKRAKAINNSINKNGFIKEKGNLMARVFIRATAERVDKKGNYVIPKEDLFSWFENGDYLGRKIESDTL